MDRNGIIAAAVQAADAAERAGFALEAVEQDIEGSVARLLYRRAQAEAEARGFVAVHESAHAIGCDVGGISYAVAHLGLEDAASVPSSGRVITHDAAPTEPNALQNYIVMLLAGGAAERRAGNPFPSDRDDRERVDVLVLRMGYPDRTRESFIRYCINLADDLVLAHWSWIQAAAEKLSDRGTITAYDVEALRSVPDEVMAA